jgi:hypothetical protein
MKKYKGTQDKTILELQVDHRSFKNIFYVYVVVSIAVMIMGGYFSQQVIMDLFNITDSVVLTLILIFCGLNLTNLFLLVFVWTTNESSYYKMLQLHNEQMIFLKRKLGE